ncbi:hypothetical protein V7S43_002535 [Phytophthora oleae]|uniref:Uncharacterized protein n=1 Tax=Phytophthora oleae TaxID=2107226 RepID=A0ABD3FY70_9STRA
MQTTLIERGDKLSCGGDADNMKKVRRAMCQLYIYLKFGSLVKTRVARVEKSEIAGAAKCSGQKNNGIESFHDGGVLRHYVFVVDSHEALDVVPSPTACSRIFHTIFAASDGAQEADKLPSASGENVQRRVAADDGFNRFAVA